MIPRPILGRFFTAPNYAVEFRDDEWREVVLDQTGNGHHLYGPWRKDDIDAAWDRVILDRHQPPRHLAQALDP
jgi:hypothetical protein